MDEFKEKLEREKANLQDSLTTTDPASDEYKNILNRLRELEELSRYHDQEDPATLEAKAKEGEVDLAYEKMDRDEAEKEKDRVHSWKTLVLKGIGIAALMFASHVYSSSSIPDKIDQKFVENFRKD